MAVVRQLVLADSEFLEYYFGVLVSLLEIVIYQPEKYHKYYTQIAHWFSSVVKALYITSLSCHS